MISDAAGRRGSKVPKNRKQAELDFYNALSPDLVDAVVISPEGFVYVEGPFSPAQLRTIADACEKYRENIKLN